MGERPSTVKEVELVISKLNCRSGHFNAIPHKIFIIFAHVLSKPISDLLNLYVSTGVLKRRQLKHTKKFTCYSYF